MTTVETIDYKGYTIEITLDELIESPRDWDNLCELHVMSNRHFGGDFNHTKEEMDSVYEEAKRNNDIIFPLYAYVHGGVVLSIGEDGQNPFYDKVSPYHAHFDSAQTGFAIVSRKRALEEFGNKKLTKKIKEHVKKITEAEINTFNDYMNGSVYAFSIKDKDGEFVDSCGGFIGDIDYIIQEAKDNIDYLTEKV